MTDRLSPFQDVHLMLLMTAPDGSCWTFDCDEFAGWEGTVTDECPEEVFQSEGLCN